MARAVRLEVNPADPNKRYVLWTNGRIEPIGTAVPVAQVESSAATPDPVGAPTFYAWAPLEPVCAMCVTDWSTPGGYTLDVWGGIHEWGSAATVPGSMPPNYFFTNFNYGFVSDFVMNPSGNGQGYYLLYNGDVIAFGTGTPAVGHSPFLTDGAIAAELVMDWASKRYWVLDTYGRIWGGNGGNHLSVNGLVPLQSLAGVAPVNTQGKLLAGLCLYDKSAAAKGWVIDAKGTVAQIGGAQTVFGGPNTPQALVWTDLAVIDDGTGANPLRLCALNLQGGQQEWVVSTAPTVTVLGPADTTVSTRPLVTWSYGDAEGDAQATWQVRVFTAAQYGAGGFDPATSTATWASSGTGRFDRATLIGVDLANATYRAYMRVTDTSGLASSWAYKQWVQNVTPPATPSVTPTVVVASLAISLALHVNPSGLSASARIGVQYHDADWDGSTWAFVVGGWDLDPDGSGNVTLVDVEPRFGVARTYRAVTYIHDPSVGTWAASAWSSTSSATLNITRWALTTPTQPTRGGLMDETAATPVKTRDAVAGVFWASGRADPIVITDGVVRFGTFDVNLYSLTAAKRIDVEAMIDSRAVMLLRDPLGRADWFIPVGSIERTIEHDASVATDDLHSYKISAQAVARPAAGPTDGPLA